MNRPLSLLPILLAFLLSFVPAAPARPADAQTITLPAYRLEAAVDYHAATLEVAETVRFRNRSGQPLGRAVFHVASAYFGAFSLRSATAQDQPASASLDGTVLDVPLPTALQPGATAEIGLRFSLAVPRRPGRLSAGQRSLALGNWFPTLAVHRGEWDRHQYTDVGDAFITEVADFDVRLTSSIPLQVATTGRVVEDSGTAFRIQAQGIRDFGLGLSPDYVVVEAQAGSASVRAYSYSRDRGRVYAEAAARYLRVYGQLLGGYPYRVFTVAEVDLPASYGGMEYPGLIFLSSAISLPTPFEGSSADILIGHEVAHQWFYSLVGNDQVADPWLDEAFATYLPYYSYHEAAPAIFNSLPASGSPGQPVDSSVYDFPDDGPYFGVVYRQGAGFLDELRTATGDAAFTQAMREVVTTFGDKLASPRAVLDTFQRHTPANLNPIVGHYFTYGAFEDPTPARWTLESPDGPWRRAASIFIAAEFPVTRVELWLDSRLLYSVPDNAVTLDLATVEPGDYALLARVLDHRGAQYERARRVTVAAPAP
jgi:hypothetical protein